QVHTALPITATPPPAYSPLPLHDALPILHDTFTADGTGHDRLLDSIRITILPSGSSANIEIALKSGDDAQSPPTIFFTSDQPLRSEEHTSELQSRENLVCRLLLEKKNKLN